ncbi:MAG: DUF349 domain-containing protein [Candidatus Nanopelagicales bacterium]
MTEHEAAPAPESGPGPAPQSASDETAEPTTAPGTDAPQASVEPEAEPVQEASAEPAPQTPGESAPRPGPRPTPGTAHRPGPAPAESFGRVEEDGTVYLRLPDGNERVVGQYAAGDATAALHYYAVKYNELSQSLELTATRLADNKCTPREALAVASKARQALEEPSFIGDISLLMARIGQLEVLSNIRAQILDEERKAAREQSQQTRERIVVEAEQLAESTAWKQGSERFRELVDQWKGLAKPSAEQREATDALWERFRNARRTFDKARKVHREEQDRKRAAAVAAKGELADQAEALADSTDWQTTAAAFRDLMDKWKKAGFAGKKDDDALWQRFRAAQEKFFSARKQTYDARDAEQKQNLSAKKALLAEAESLVPVKDAKAARRAFRDIQGKWSDIGHVPRADMRKIDTRMRAVDDAIRSAESALWRRTNPEIRDRAQGLVDAYRASVAKLEAQLAAARASGDESKVAAAQQNLNQQRLMLESAEQSLSTL